MTTDQNKIIDEKKLAEWLKHVAGIGSPITITLLTGGTYEIEATPHYFTDCETCKEIAAYLQKYHTATE